LILCIASHYHSHKLGAKVFFRRVFAGVFVDILKVAAHDALVRGEEVGVRIAAEVLDSAGTRVFDYEVGEYPADALHAQLAAQVVDFFLVGVG